MERDIERATHEGGRPAREQSEESLNPQAEGKTSADDISNDDNVIPLGPAQGDSRVERHSAEYESETWDD